MDNQRACGSLYHRLYGNGLEGVSTECSGTLGTEYSANEFWASVQQDAECSPPTFNGPVCFQDQMIVEKSGMQKSHWKIFDEKRFGQWDLPAIRMETEYRYGRRNPRQSNKMNFQLDGMCTFAPHYSPYSNTNAYAQYNHKGYTQTYTQYYQYQPDYGTERNNQRMPKPGGREPTQKLAPLPAWTPEVYPDPHTGEMHSLPGTSQIYSNGQPYPDTQLYVDTQAARNMPADRPLWDPNEVQPQQQQQPTQPNSNPSEEEMSITHFVDLETLGLACVPPQSYISPRYMDNEHNWPLIFEIYGTAIGIILKCMWKEINIQGTPSDFFRQDKWLQEQGLPYPATRWILDRYYFPNPFFSQVGDRVISGTRKRRELKEKIKIGVEAGMWPGDTDFSELRNACETLRRKALELLERWGDLFEREWSGSRQKRDGYYQ